MRNNVNTTTSGALQGKKESGERASTIESADKQTTDWQLERIVLVYSFLVESQSRMFDNRIFNYSSFKKINQKINRLKLSMMISSTKDTRRKILL